MDLRTRPRRLMTRTSSRKTHVIKNRRSSRGNDNALFFLHGADWLTRHQQAKKDQKSESSPQQDRQRETDAHARGAATRKKPPAISTAFTKRCSTTSTLRRIFSTHTRPACSLHPHPEAAGFVCQPARRCHFLLPYRTLIPLWLIYEHHATSHSHHPPSSPTGLVPEDGDFK